MAIHFCLIRKYRYYSVPVSQPGEIVPVYDEGQSLHVEVVLQFPLGVLQHLHGVLCLRQFSVQL